MTLFEKGAAVSEGKVVFDEEEVEGKVHELEADTEADMLICACFIAECLTFRRQIEIKNQGVEKLRRRVVENIVRFS